MRPRLARSKAKESRRIRELGRSVQMLRIEAEALSAELAHLQEESSGLLAVNSELKLLLQSMERHGHMQEDTLAELNEEVKNAEIQFLLATSLNLSEGASSSEQPAAAAAGKGKSPAVSGATVGQGPKK